jgi:hypothetical protein
VIGSLWLWLLLLIAAVAVVAFYAGRVSTKSYIEAAKDVNAVTNAIATQSNTYSSSLDKAAAESASLRAAVVRLTEVTIGKQGDVEAVLLSLCQALHPGGVPGRARGTPGRQVGETGQE